MRDFEKVNMTAAPFYEQFEQLGGLYQAQFLSWGFLCAARKLFGKQYFYELTLLFKAEKRLLKHEFKLGKYEDKKQFKVEWRKVKAHYKALRKNGGAEETPQMSEGDAEEIAQAEGLPPPEDQSS